MPSTFKFSVFIGISSVVYDGIVHPRGRRCQRPPGYISFQAVHDVADGLHGLRQRFVADLAFENDDRTYPICSQTDYIYRTKGSYAGNFKAIVDRIMISDTGSTAEARELWANVRYFNGINTEELQAYVDSVANELDESQRLNFYRWPIMNKKVHQNPKIWGSYEAEVKNVRDYLARRIVWMDKKLKYDEETFVTSLAEMAAAGPQPEIHVWNRHVFVGGIAGGTPYNVFSTQGTLEAQGISGEEGPLLTPGIHIISIHGQSQKILVR